MLEVVQYFVVVTVVAVAVQEVVRQVKLIEELAVEAVAVVLVSPLELLVKVEYHKQVQIKLVVLVKMVLMQLKLLVELVVMVVIIKTKHLVQKVVMVGRMANNHKKVVTHQV